MKRISATHHLIVIIKWGSAVVGTRNAAITSHVFFFKESQVKKIPPINFHQFSSPYSYILHTLFAILFGVLFQSESESIPEKYNIMQDHWITMCL